MACPLDHTAFPHILDRILDLSPIDSLLLFRQCSRALRERADALAYTHVTLTGKLERTISQPSAEDTHANAHMEGVIIEAASYTYGTERGTLAVFKVGITPYPSPSTSPRKTQLLSTLSQHTRVLDLVNVNRSASSAVLLHFPNLHTVRVRSSNDLVFGTINIRTPLHTLVDLNPRIRTVLQRGTKRLVTTVSDEVLDSGRATTNLNVGEIVVVYRPAPPRAAPTLFTIDEFCARLAKGVNRCPLGALDTLGTAIVLSLTGLERVTFVALDEAPPWWLGFGRRPISADQMRQRVVQAFHTIIDHERNRDLLRPHGLERLKLKVDQFEFVSREEYRARVGEETFRLHTEVGM